MTARARLPELCPTLGVNVYIHQGSREHPAIRAMTPALAVRLMSTGLWHHSGMHGSRHSSIHVEDCAVLPVLNQALSDCCQRRRCMAVQRRRRRLHSLWAPTWRRWACASGRVSPTTAPLWLPGGTEATDSTCLHVQETSISLSFRSICRVCPPSQFDVEYCGFCCLTCSWLCNLHESTIALWLHNQHTCFCAALWAPSKSCCDLNTVLSAAEQGRQVQGKMKLSPCHAGSEHLPSLRSTAPHDETLNENWVVMALWRALAHQHMSGRQRF